jgi:hypothetical protein
VSQGVGLFMMFMRCELYTLRQPDFRSPSGRKYVIQMRLCIERREISHLLPTSMGRLSKD